MVPFRFSMLNYVDYGKEVRIFFLVCRVEGLIVVIDFMTGLS